MPALSDYLASAAALLAALLSGISLVLTRRWQRADLERDRAWRDSEQERHRAWLDAQYAVEADARTKAWVLENLREALIEHINLSFKIGRACSEGRERRSAGDQQGAMVAFNNAEEIHHQYMDRLVYLRLLGTPDLVASAEKLHDSLDNLLDLTFSEEKQQLGRRDFKSGALPEGFDFAQAKSNCIDMRLELINNARTYLGLPADARIGPDA